MSKSSDMFLDDKEENYFQEKGYIDEEKNAYIRSLWKEIDGEIIVKASPLMGKALTLYNKQEDQNLQPDYV